MNASIKIRNIIRRTKYIIRKTEIEIRRAEVEAEVSEAEVRKAEAEIKEDKAEIKRAKAEIKRAEAYTKGVCNREIHFEPKIEYYEIVEFLSGYNLQEKGRNNKKNDKHKKDDERKKYDKHKILKNTFNQFNNGRFDKIRYDDYNELVHYLKQQIIEDSIFDTDIFVTPMFKLYSLYNIERRYMYEIVSTIAKCLGELIEKRVEKDVWELFLDEVVPLMHLPLLKTRNTLVDLYLQCLKKGSLDKWRRTVQDIKTALYATEEKMKEAIHTWDADTLNTVHPGIASVVDKNEKT